MEGPEETAPLAHTTLAVLCLTWHLGMYAYQYLYPGLAATETLSYSYQSPSGSPFFRLPVSAAHENRRQNINCRVQEVDPGQA